MSSGMKTRGGGGENRMPLNRDSRQGKAKFQFFFFFPVEGIIVPAWVLEQVRCHEEF